ncbi:MAG: DUF1127 domain-containing protein [Rhodospirillales bacterium]|nr:DUF1127 domain-containing protein [Rhodospirillales bacterium]
MTEFNLSSLHPASWTGSLFHRQAAAPSASLSAGGRLVDRLLAWQDRATQRRQLAELDASLLADIGLSRAAADHEAGKAFWRL